MRKEQEREECSRSIERRRQGEGKREKLRERETKDPKQLTWMRREVVEKAARDMVSVV